MKILVVGSGAREHALCWALSTDPAVERIVCAPGNAGLAAAFPTVAVDVADPAALLALAEQQDADLTVIGPEIPLGRGAVDVFEASGRPIFGPRQSAARSERDAGSAGAGSPLRGDRSCRVPSRCGPNSTRAATEIIIVTMKMSATL